MKNPFKFIFPKLRKNKNEAPPDEIKKSRERLDPLDHRHRSGSWSDEDRRHAFRIISAKDFPFLHDTDAEVEDVEFRDGTVGKTSAIVGMAMDGSVATMDDSVKPALGLEGEMGMNPYTVPTALMAWYASQSFIGYQACAIIAQHWLVDKACSMSGEDAIRNGWEIKAKSDSVSISDEQLATIKNADEEFSLTEQMKELNRFRNIFGIRILIFKIESEDPNYYAKPFNIDGITPGSYKGISQVDPYWMMPMMTAESTADPSSEHFYDPEFWVISGVRYHRSHLVIVRGPEPADLLKPTYIFGGIPLTQRIYERVYAAERTANEAPLLAMNKRTTAIHVDMEKALANQDAFTERLMMWIKYRDNHAVKVLGEEESMEQFDTALSDFDSVIMNQFQLVAAIAKTPATKLLGTSPKGFNSSGDYESINYHEELESIQQHVMTPFLTRHYDILVKSLGLDLEIQHIWEPVDSITMQQQAELNKTKAETGAALIEGGVISPDEERNRIRDDKYSGYNRLQNDDASQDPGMSPEALSKFEKTDAEKDKAQAAQTVAGAKAEQAGTGAVAQGAPGEEPPEKPEVAVPFGRKPSAQETQPTKVPAASLVQKDEEAAPSAEKVQIALLENMSRLLSMLEDRMMPEGHDGTADFAPYSGKRSTQPGIRGATSASTSGQSSIVGEMPAHKLPKMKLHGMSVSIENPRGTIRQGMDIGGNSWSQKMPHHYGYIRGTNGADDDEMDCFIGPNPESQKVFVINQKDSDGSFDEHKCMIGFNSADEARQAYSDSFSKDWRGFDSIVPMSIPQFKAWMKDGDCYSPLSAACIAQTQSAPQTE